MFWDAWTVECVEKLCVWLMVYNILQGAHILRTLTIIYLWGKAKDPSYQQIKVEVFYGIWVFLFEAGWLIYGNTFIYSITCNVDLGSIIGNASYINTDTLVITAKALIIYGYILFLGVLLTICFFIGILLGYRSYVKADTEAKNALESKPTLTG